MTSKELYNSFQWKEFVVGDIFNIVRGKTLTKTNIIEGKLPFITASSLNNGISSYIGNEMKVWNNAITVCSNGEPGVSFYHNYDFTASGDVCVLTNKNLNDKVGVFLCACLEKLKPKYSYGKKLGIARLKEEIIHLPITDEGEINFEAMEEYMILLDSEIIPEIGVPDLSKEEILLDSVDWAEFVVEDLFDIETGKGNKHRNSKGKFPYITATTQNNGVLDNCSKAEHPGNVLTMASDGNGLGTTFYQENPFSGQSINVLTLKGKELNKYSGLFLSTSLEKLQPKYSYGKKLGITRLKSEKIWLPITENGDPNYQFMEDYIKSLSFSEILN